MNEEVFTFEIGEEVERKRDRIRGRITNRKVIGRLDGSEARPKYQVCWTHDHKGDERPRASRTWNYAPAIRKVATQ